MPSVHLTDLKYTASRGFACGRGYEWFEVSTRALNGRDSTGEGVIRGTAGVRERAHGEAVTHLGQEGLLQAPTHDLSAHAGVLEVRHTGDAPVGLREEGEGDRFSALPGEAGFYLEAGGRRAGPGTRTRRGEWVRGDTHRRVGGGRHFKFRSVRRARALPDGSPPRRDALHDKCQGLNSSDFRARSVSR